MNKEKDNKVLNEIIFIIKKEISSATGIDVDAISDAEDFKIFDIDSMKMMLMIGNIENELIVYDANFELGYDAIYKNTTPHELAIFILNQIKQE